MKKVVHVLSLKGIGGVQKNFLDYYKSIDVKENNLHKVYVIGRKSKLFLNKNFFSLYSFFSIITFLYYLRSKKYIIHFYNNFGSIKLYYLLILFKSNNIIIHERGTSWNLNSKFSHRLKFISSKCDKIIVNSKATKFLIINKFNLHHIVSKIEVIYNGINIENNHNIRESFSNKKKQIFKVGFIGRIETPKSVHTLIDVANILKNKKNHYIYEFIIAGDGNLLNFIKDYAKDIPNIKFIGFVKDHKLFFKQINLLLVPSIREPFGNIILEAGICKIPVIASFIDGIPEIIDNNLNGILIEPNKPVFENVFFSDQISKPEYVFSPILNKLIPPKEIDPNTLALKLIEVSEDDLLIQKLTFNLYNKVKLEFNMTNYKKAVNKIYKSFNINEN